MALRGMQCAAVNNPTNRRVNSKYVISMRQTGFMLENISSAKIQNFYNRDKK